MKNRWIGGLWAQLPLAALVAGWQALAVTPENLWIVPVLLVMWFVTVAAVFKPAWRERLAQPVRRLRCWPLGLWLLALALIVGGISLWLVNYQPTLGRPLKQVEVTWNLALLWLLLYLLFYDLGEAEARVLGGRLSRNPFTGIMVTLTSAVIIFFSAEAYLRIFYITTDSYSFTAMNYHWYQNYYFGHWNSFGYRDHEARTDPALIRVAIVGDSFVVGHGINNLDDTFPQVLERELGPAYDVNVVAGSGWDTDVEEAWLNGYPLKPDIVVLSYFLNDVEYLLSDPALNPNRHFRFPDDPQLSWFVLNFFVPNYIYYNLLQYTSTDRSDNYAATLVDTHLDDRFWQPHSEKLASLINWTENHHAQMIALIWPLINNVEFSRPATRRVRDFFAARGVPVVDMTDALADKNPAEMVVNRWDAHPGPAADYLAAGLLYDAILKVNMPSVVSP